MMRQDADTLRAELAARNAAHETEHWILLTEGDLVDLASGFVPQAVKAQIVGLLDGRAEATRRAGRPVQTTRTVKG